MKPRPFLVPLIAASLSLLGAAAGAEPVAPPDLDKEIFNEAKVKLEMFQRSGVVSTLVSVASDFGGMPGVDNELRAHALALAARLDRDNKRVLETLEQFRAGIKAGAKGNDKERVARRLADGVDRLLRESGNKDNRICAAYLADIGLRFDPRGAHAGDLAKARAGLEAEGIKADWTGMIGPVPGVRAPRPPGIRMKELLMPGGEAGKFAQPQSRVNGLVVRDLGNGRLAGSTSTVNATALPERGQKDLLFAFNQNVGPMMSGSLEEGIKFLRVRYADQPEMIPTGYRIELGFQDKYVPKDGPSAATAFTLLLDSLFSGEELDENFACTGDMTADGRVQKIGGAAAKIRGATKRGCKIVGIPHDNGREIGDVLLLDGIQQLLDIQIFTLKDFDEAYAISRARKEPEVVGTLALFNEIARVVNRDGEAILAHSKVQQRLQQVIEKMPNHLSAQLLLQKGRGTNPKVLTVRGTMDQIKIASSGTLHRAGRALGLLQRGDKEAFGFDKETVAEAKAAVAELDALEKALDPRLRDYRAAVAKVCKAVAEGPGEEEEARVYGKRLAEALRAMQASLGKTMEDPEILEDMG